MNQKMTIRRDPKPAAYARERLWDQGNEFAVFKNRFYSIHQGILRQKAAKRIRSRESLDSWNSQASNKSNIAQGVDGGYAQHLRCFLPQSGRPMGV